jgi:hypothetical protein
MARSLEGNGIMSLRTRIELLNEGQTVYSFFVPSGYIDSWPRGKIAQAAVDQLKFDVPFSQKMGKPITDDWDTIRFCFAADDQPEVPRETLKRWKLL